MPSSALHRLLRLKDSFGAEAAAAKLAALRSLGRGQLRSAAQVRDLHDVLCFWRAYPDDARVLREVDRRLAAFGERSDVQRVRKQLVSSGIAGTDIVYAFKYLTALWLAERWPEQMRIEWSSIEDEARLTQVLITLALAAEVPGLDEAPREGRAWLERLCGGQGDAAWLMKRVAAMPATALVRDRYYEDLGISCRLSAGYGTPERTTARLGGAAVTYQTKPMRRQRPDLRVEIDVPPNEVRSVSRAEAQRLIDLARVSMVTRQRDLDAFVWADPGDVRLVDCGEGLQFVLIGCVPERRFLLESMYGLLTLKNGIPIGYALVSGLMQYAEVAYNVFETFRGGEAAHVYARLLATTRWLFDAREYTIHPYQLGDGNDEGLDSGAWWFYYKLGFRPRTRRANTLVTREVARIAKDPMYRTPRRTLELLVRDRLYWAPFPIPRNALIEPLRLDRIGLAVTRALTARFGDDRERALRTCSDEAAALLGVGNWRKLPAGERVAWERWAPLVAILSGVPQWSAAERHALADVIRAKGGRYESDYVARFDAHHRLRAAIVKVGT